MSVYMNRYSLIHPISSSRYENSENYMLSPRQYLYIMALSLIKELIFIDIGHHTDYRMRKYIDDMSYINLHNVLSDIEHEKEIEIYDIPDDMLDIITKISKIDKRYVLRTLNIWIPDSYGVNDLNRYLKKYIDMNPLRIPLGNEPYELMNPLMHNRRAIACFLLKRYKDKLKEDDIDDITITI